MALFHLWLTGELMTSRRQGFERVYDLRSRVAPEALDYAAPVAEAEAFFGRKSLAFLGLQRQRPWITTVSDSIQRKISPAEGKAWLGRLVDRGEAAVVQVEGSKELWYTLSPHLALLEELERGQTPAEWQALGPTTLDEVSFLAPLEITSARGRAKFVFDFDYIWEVYKPAAQRRWGYYTIPILYDDQLVGRLDPRLERKTGTLFINGFWLEEGAPRDDPQFAAALGAGLRRFAQFIQAGQIDLSAVEPPPLRQWLERAV